MSCQQASRTQEDPYAFTESAPLQANSLVYANHSSAVSNSSINNSTSTSGNALAANSNTTIVSSGASLLLATSVSNGNAAKDNVVVTTPSQQLRVGSSPTLKVRYNGVVATTPATAVAGVQRTSSAVAVTQPFTKPAVQIRQQQSPLQYTVAQSQQPMVTVGKQSKKVAPQQKSPMVTAVVASGPKVVSPLQQQPRVLQQQSTVLSTAGGSILKFIKIPPQQLGKGVSASGTLPQGSFIQVTTSGTDGARKLLATTGNTGMNTNSISVTNTATPAVITTANRNISGVPTVPSVSPTKIRLIQPQSQGKIYLQAPNNGSLSGTTHISNPISIAALRNSLVKQQQQQQVTQLQQQVVQVPPQSLGQQLKQQQIIQQSPSRSQLQGTQQALQLQQTQQSQLLLQQTKQKQALSNAIAFQNQQQFQTKQAPKPLLQASSTISLQSQQKQEGVVNSSTQGPTQHVRQVQSQKSALQINHSSQAVQIQQQKQSLLVQQQQQQQQQQTKQLSSPPQQQQASQRKQLQLPQTKGGRQGTQQTPPKPSGSLSSPGSSPIMTGVANGSLLVKVNSSPVVGAVNTTGVSKTATLLDNQALPSARRSSGQQSLLIGAATEKVLSQQQTLVTNSAAADSTLSRSPLSVMVSEAKKEIAASPADHVFGSINEQASRLEANVVNERNGGAKIKQQSGRKSVTKTTAKQPKAGKRTYNQRLVEERQGKPKCAPLPTSLVMSLGSVPGAAASGPEPESFQAAFAKMARPAAPETYRGGVECKPAFSSSSMPTPKSTKVKKESARKLFGADCNQQDGGEMKPVKLKFVAPKVPGAVAVPITRPKVREWHAPGAYMFDLKDPGDESDDDVYEERPNTLSFWYEESIAITAVPNSTTGWGMNPRQASGMRGGRNNKHTDSLHDVKFQIRMLTRDERLELKKAYLQRRVVQCRNGLRMRHISTAKRKLESMATLIKRLDKRRQQAMTQESEKPKCIHEGCGQSALVMTSHCYNHITENKDQRLFQRCTAKFADNSQCRQPVFDISHELVLCKEHAWKHDNHDKMSQEVRSQKKSPSVAAAVLAATTVTSGAPTSSTLIASRKKVKSAPPVVVVRPQKRPKKKKKLSPLQQQLQLHQQHYKQFVTVNQQQHAHCVPPNQTASVQGNVVVQSPANIVYQQQQQQQPLQQSNTMVLHQNVPLSNGVQHIPLMNADNSQSHGIIGSTVYHAQQDDTPMQLVDHTLQQQHSQEHEILKLDHHHQQLPDEQLMLNYMQEQQLQLQQQQHQHHHQQQQQKQQMLQQQQQQLQYNNGPHSMQPMLNTSTNQDLLTICENSSAYASSEDTGVGGLSESELMATQEVIEEIIPFEIGNLLNTNVLSQLAPDALNELLFASGDQEEHDTSTAFEGTTREVEDDIERALEHVKSLDDMAVESANFLGDFLENVDDEMLDGADICSTEQMLQSPNNGNDIRGLVHT
ncbi:uncharacterized protein LOC131284883 [Anopheles ziemanni]|uniref:uncharacterized protein LOC131284883 n=1 Tax=Anopheles ziemanni TaxID=345580 RepID=UPI00265F7705|nr:uncharacterized protein LOC131284883 [Anopheles ziemanni]